MRRLLPFLAALFLLSASLAPAQTPPGLKKIGIGDVKITPSLLEANQKAGKTMSLDRVTEALDDQLIDRMHNTRKFEVMARSDLASLLKDADATAAAFNVPGIDYLVVTTVDDFADVNESKFFPALGKTVERRTIRFSAVAKIYDTKEGKLIESTNFQLSNRDAQEALSGLQSDGTLSDELLIKLCRQMAQKIADRVVDVIFPAKVVSKIGQQVTINRGDGTGIAMDQVWEVFAVGDVITDPDTGAVLGREELSVGKVKITRVNPTLSQAQILEDTGIDRGAIVRPVVQPASDE